MEFKVETPNYPAEGSYDFLGDEVTLEMQNGNYPELGAELARVSGKELAFSPTKPDMIFNVGFKRAALWDVLKLLSYQGTIHVAGQDLERLKRLRKLLLSGAKNSFALKIRLLTSSSMIWLA